MRFWFDTEFIEDGNTIELISIGIVSSDGREYYAEVSGVDYNRASQWVKDNVIVHLTGETKSREVIASEIKEFVGDNPEFWAYYADYDWIALCQLYGTMMDLPDTWPKFCLDIKQNCYMLGVSSSDLPEQSTTEHHALEDARWNRKAWRTVNLKSKIIDNMYMLDMYYVMLGPIAKELVDIWNTKNIKRVHYDVSLYHNKSGEEIAEHLLELERYFESSSHLYGEEDDFNPLLK
jgi:3' exoribonuclease, RNase T-like